MAPSKSLAELEKAINRILATRNAASPKSIVSAIKSIPNHEGVFVEILKDASLSLISGVGKATERKLFVDGITKIGDCLKDTKYKKVAKVLFVKSKKDLDKYLALLKEFAETKSSPGETTEIKAPAAPSTPTMPKKPKLAPPMIQISLEKKTTKVSSLPEDDDDDLFNIPDVPPPKLLNAPKLSVPEIAAEGFSKSQLQETDEMKPVLIDCKWCGKNIVVPVEKKLVLDNELPVVPVTYIHGSPKHALILHLDHDFQVRRRRLSDIINE